MTAAQALAQRCVAAAKALSSMDEESLSEGADSRGPSRRSRQGLVIQQAEGLASTSTRRPCGTGVIGAGDHCRAWEVQPWSPVLASCVRTLSRCKSQVAMQNTLRS